MPIIGLVEGSRLIAAPSDEIFELLADPARHRRIDGSDTVIGVQERTPVRLSPGAKFGMQMRWGMRYKILNEVVEFDEGRRIAWRHFGGHIWRYILKPVDANTTEVTEQFDPRSSRSPMLLRIIRASQRNQRSIDQTLVRLEDWARTKTLKN